MSFVRVENCACCRPGFNHHCSNLCSVCTLILYFIRFRLFYPRPFRYYCILDRFRLYFFHFLVTFIFLVHPLLPSLRAPLHESWLSKEIYIKSGWGVPSPSSTMPPIQLPFPSNNFTDGFSLFSALHPWSFCTCIRPLENSIVSIIVVTTPLPLPPPLYNIADTACSFEFATLLHS